MHEDLTVRVLGPELVRFAFSAALGRLPGVKVVERNARVTLLAGADWADALAELALPAEADEAPGLALLLPEQGDAEELLGARERGVRVFVSRQDRPDALPAALQAAAAGRPYCSEGALPLLMEATRGRRRAPAGGAELLTENELEVARLVVQGLTNREIAALRYTSEGTVKQLLHAIYAKLGIERRTQVVHHLPPPPGRRPIAVTSTGRA